MIPYLKELAALVLGAFVGTLLSLVLAGEAFNAWSFQWGPALQAAASAALVALLKGVIGRFRGDPETISWRKE